LFGDEAWTQLKSHFFSRYHLKTVGVVIWMDIVSDKDSKEMRLCNPLLKKMGSFMVKI
jgi:hypothetical protein